MADTRPDVQLDDTQYINAYTASGITTGSAILIQNKSSQDIYIQIKSTKPAATSRDGGIIKPYEQGLIDSGESGCWILGLNKGKISIQEA